MRIKVDSAVLSESRWYEFGIRFLFGGLITAAAGLIATRFGAEIGGLFLAFPAILPASATLVEKHEKQRKVEKGLNGSVRARRATGVDAAGATIGSLGLIAFAATAALLLTEARMSLVLLCATIAWGTVSAVIWHLRREI